MTGRLRRERRRAARARASTAHRVPAWARTEHVRGVRLLASPFGNRMARRLISDNRPPVPTSRAPEANHRLADILRALPQGELDGLIARLGVRIDPAKRIDVPSQVARALVSLPELRDPSRLHPGFGRARAPRSRGPRARSSSRRCRRRSSRSSPAGLMFARATGRGRRAHPPARVPRAAEDVGGRGPALAPRARSRRRRSRR